MTATKGSWRGVGPLSYEYRWLRCFGDGDCEPIDGATSRSYRAGPADRGRRLRMRVTATDSSGDRSVRSRPSDRVEGLPPSNERPPTIGGPLEVGGQLNADPGDWSGSSVSFHYRWLRCEVDGSSCHAITGAASAGYVTTSDDVHHPIRVLVMARNGSGADDALSEPTEGILSVGEGQPGDPDAERIFFQASSGTWSVLGDGSGLTHVTDCDASLEEPSELCRHGVSARSPDGSYLAGPHALSPTGEYSDGGAASIMTTDGTVLGEAVFSAHQAMGPPRYSPDGAKLVFSRHTDDWNGTWFDTPLGGWAIFDAEIDGDLTDGNRLTSEPGFQFDPDYSADGRWLLWSQQDSWGAPRRTWLARADGTHAEPLHLADPDYELVNPRFSPDAKHIAFWNDGIGIVDVATGHRRMLAMSGNSMMFAAPEWSPDGQRIYFNAYTQTGVKIFSVDVHGDAAPRPLLTAGAPAELQDDNAGPVLRQAQRSAVHASVDHQDGDYVDGRSDVPIDVVASGPAHVQSISLRRIGGGEIGTTTADCTAGCPERLADTYEFDPSSLPEGEAGFVARAVDGHGFLSSDGTSIYVDRSAPEKASDVRLSDSGDVTWIPGDDPGLPGRLAGSGVDRQMYRYRPYESDGSFGSWSPWQKADRDLYGDRDGFNIGTQQSFEVSIGTVDNVGNVSTERAYFNPPDASYVESGPDQDSIDSFIDAMNETGRSALAPSRATSAVGQRIDPGLEHASSGGLRSSGTLTASWFPSDPTKPFGMETNWGNVTFTPLHGRANARHARVIRGDAAAYTGTRRATDTVARPTAMGVETFSHLRDRSAPETFSWRVHLAGGQVLKLLRDGRVAIEPATAEARPDRTKGKQSATPLRRSAPEDESLTKASAQLDRSRTALAGAGREINGFLVAVLAAPWAKDANGRAVPTSLSVDGDVITMHVLHRNGHFAYPILADPDLIDCRLGGPDPCGTYNGYEAAKYVFKWAKEGEKRRNPSYPNYSANALGFGGNGDCTNFINQALKAGGLAFMRQYDHGLGSWWVRVRYVYSPHGAVGVNWDATDSWTLATALERHLIAYGLAEELPSETRDWMPGDLVFFDYVGHDTLDDPHEFWDHVNIVTAVVDGVPYVGQHDLDYPAKDLTARLKVARDEHEAGVVIKHLRPVHNFANIYE